MSGEEEKIPSDHSDALAELDDDLASVTASESELVEDDTKSLRFGKILMIEKIFQTMAGKRILDRALARLPGDEVA